MKKRVIPAVCAAFGLLWTNTAADTAADAGIEFDFNRDGKTDRTDWQELSSWIEGYRMKDDSNVYFAEQEVPATINLLIDEWYGNRQSGDYGIAVSDTPEYYLPSIGGSSTVKSQNPFGTCWAFGIISSLESNLLLSRSGTIGTIDPNGTELQLDNASDQIDLSELYLAIENGRQIKEGSQAGEGTSPLSEDINAELSIGAFPSSGQTILTGWDGPLTEEQEPYAPLRADEDGANIYDLRDEAADKASLPAAHVQSFVYIDSPAVIRADLDRKVYSYKEADESAISRMKQALVKYGALMMCYCADISMPNDVGNGDYLNYTNWAQYDDRMDIGMNHMTSIVGWNDNYPKENFLAGNNSVPEKDGAWLVKNSWGNYDLSKEELGDVVDELLDAYKGTEYEPSFNSAYNYGIPNEQGHGTGYFWISYYDHSILSVCAAEADDASDGFDYDHMYQYDFARQVSIIPVSLPTSDADTKAANVFTAERNESLAAVSAFAPYNDCTVNITVKALPDENSDPSAGTVLLETTAELNEKGFHTIPLSEPVNLNKGDRFAVIENVVSEHEGKQISWLNLETCIKEELQTTDNINNQTMRVMSNPGETYVYVTNGTEHAWTDVETLNSESDAAEAFTFGNAYIKAYTKDRTAETPQAAAPASSDSSTVTAAMVIGIAAAAYILFIAWKTR